MDVRAAQVRQSRLARMLVAAGLLLAGAASAAAEQAAGGAEPSAAAGKQLYTAKCARCHGFNMVSPGTLAYDLRRFPAGDPERFRNSVRKGKGAMPAWQDVLQDADIDALWAYVLTRGK